MAAKIVLFSGKRGRGDAPEPSKTPQARFQAEREKCADPYGQ